MITLNTSKRTCEIYIDNRENKDLNGYHVKTENNELLIVNDTLFIFYSNYKKQQKLVYHEYIKGKETSIAFFGCHIHKSLKEAEDDFKKFVLYMAIPTFVVFLPCILYMLYKITGN